MHTYLYIPVPFYLIATFICIRQLNDRRFHGPSALPALQTNSVKAPGIKESKNQFFVNSLAKISVARWPFLGVLIIQRGRMQA